MDSFDDFMDGLDLDHVAEPEGETLENEDTLLSSTKHLLTKRAHKNNKSKNDGAEKRKADYGEIGDADELTDLLKKARKTTVAPLPPRDHSAFQYEAVNKVLIDPHTFNREEYSSAQVAAFREEAVVAVTGSDGGLCFPLFEFGDLQEVAPKLCQMLENSKKFQRPSAIQRACIPCALAGRDVLGVAETGSGKTLAFLIPLLIHALSRQRWGVPTGLIMAPTRELVLQIELEWRRFTHLGLKTVCLTGGIERKSQIQYLNAGVDGLIGTPGRLTELINDQFLDLQQISFLVLDEADRILDMGFEAQLRSVVQHVYADRRQVLMFSATMPAKIESLARDILNNPLRISVGQRQEGSFNSNIDQNFEVVQSDDLKGESLLRTLAAFLPEISIIFVKTKDKCAKVENMVRKAKLKVYSLHGDVDQAQRMAIMDKLKERGGSPRVLVATDIAARGLDIHDVELVINFDAPKDLEFYLHRIGRTGRFGQKGSAVTYLTQKDQQFAAQLAAGMNEGESLSRLEAARLTLLRSHEAKPVPAGFIPN